MVLLGIDPHKDTHTIVVVVDQAGRQLDQRTVPAPTLGHGELVGSGSDALARAAAVGGGGLPACHRPGWNGTAGRRGTGRAGAAAADGRRPPSGADTGKSDPIDALAVARAALREPTSRSPTTTRPAGSSGCWSTIASTWSPNPPRRSTGCAGTCTSSTRPGTHHPAAARPGPGSQHRLARPGRRRPRLGGAGQDLPGPGQRHPGPQRPDRPAGPSTAPTRRPAGPIPAQPARLRAADRGQAHR
jgi:hypothetical protein